MQAGGLKNFLPDFVQFAGNFLAGFGDEIVVSKRNSQAKS